MKKIYFVLISLICISCNGQNDEKELSQKVKQDAEIMGQYLIDQKLDSFALYTHPKLIELVGGKERMIQSIRSGSIEMESKGIKILSVSFDEPSKIINVEDELQCTLQQTVKMSVPKGVLVNVTTLVAISNDSGKTWTFWDASNKDFKSLKKVLPKLSEELVIIPSQQPIFYPE